ncbi:hypothetical protein [Acaryochloris sp. CCMEE 5410]|uniref:hypothetical protein n=1 Tax=Acaryochloris sp. CCMEE 5410 TaxID=310037 RepID=UPI0002484D54|nr:hypothetical protein [Acaryochloris sp. CCMEE 5410]
MTATTDETLTIIPGPSSQIIADPLPETLENGHPIKESGSSGGQSPVPIQQPTQNIFWITHEASYLNSKLTCVKTTRTHTQARLDAYYILSEGYGAFDENCDLSDIEPSEESVCHLLVTARSLILGNPNKLTIWEARHRAIETGKQERWASAVGYRAMNGAFSI